MDSTQVGFWDERYRAGRMPWDLMGAPPVLAAYLRRSPGPGTALVPGCGSAYEIRTFHEAGWEALAIDFAPAAVDRARTLLGPLGKCVRLADFFTDEFGGPFDLMYERTFLCSLPPALWPDYARRAARLLKPGGRLAGIFFHGDEPEPPPFPLDQETARRLFDPLFTLESDEPAPEADSLPIFGGRERWQVWRRR